MNAYHSFEVPNTSGVKFHDLLTVSLGNVGEHHHVINGTGGGDADELHAVDGDQLPVKRVSVAGYGRTYGDMKRRADPR